MECHNGMLTTEIRAALGTLFITALAFPLIYQPLLSWVWDELRDTRFYRWSTFETLWTVFWYAAIEVSLTVVFMKNPSWRFTVQEREKRLTSGDGVRTPGRAKGMRRPSRRLKEIATYITPLLLMDLTMIKKFAGVPLESMLLSGNYDPAALTAMHRSTFLVPTLHNMTASSPLQTQRALPIGAPSSRRLVLELLTSLVIYDALFFLFHLALHTIPPFRRLHAPHHRHAEINPQITNQLHVVERLGLVLLANFSLNIIGSHVLTRTLFVPVFVWLLVEIHSGMDLPWGYEKILPQGWGAGARRHMMHHTRAEGGLAPYFTWCDRALAVVSDPFGKPADG
ncbi:hypothetical protein W97_01946 [Coniosporium apollinis CBS 100218]|uniref:Fatty acid hydroxylase domain-containing protein n=1 Tax=Coniosporium apollinis (strain CBS 100218) TaxID=1168221 RepID=R7YLC1_CONA1|nr:uncharacterized protein W97_01946 [Coniosporium apollinis CBS 100218]EON62722.1 hypothetical protein W97_01946 [Coniosporium apollinis CBS 100218]